VPGHQRTRRHRGATRSPRRPGRTPHHSALFPTADSSVAEGCAAGRACMTDLLDLAGRAVPVMPGDGTRACGRDRLSGPSPRTARVPVAERRPDAPTRTDRPRNSVPQTIAERGCNHGCAASDALDGWNRHAELESGVCAPSCQTGEGVARNRLRFIPLSSGIIEECRPSSRA